MQIGTGGLIQFAGAIGIVFLLYLVRAHGIAPFATLLAFDAGMNLASVVVLRAISDLTIAVLLYLGAVQWQRMFGGRPAGRVGRWLVGVREQVGRGNVFVNFIAANYFLNTYIVFGTVATLPQARRRAFAGALIGGSRTTLTLAITGATRIGAADPRTGSDPAPPSPSPSPARPSPSPSRTNSFTAASPLLRRSRES